MRSLLLILSLAVCAVGAAAQSSRTCSAVDDCRRLALEAAARDDFETFHDFAWLTVRKGRPNDPDLMYLLARAQSLSGRPHDALVMLRRLAGLGVATDADTNDDFRRVRALTGWTEFAALAAEIRDKKVLRSDPVQRATPSGASPGAPTASAAPAAPSPRGAPAGPSDSASRSGALTIARRSFAPVGLAYDAVSRRFIAGDRRANKLMVLDEEFRRVNDLAAAASAGFFGLTALEIDRRRGDLWVSNAKDDGSETGLHKLQLISGRVLQVFPLPSTHGPARFGDITVTGEGAILALDVLGKRIFRLWDGTYAPPLTIEADGPQSITALDEHVVYVATPTGLLRVDLVSHAVAPVRGRRGVNLKGLAHIRAHRGSIIGVQREGGTLRLINVSLHAARAQALSARVITDVPIADPTSLAIDGDTLHYLARESDGGTTVRHIKLGASR
jgi:hypothetical protein